MPIRRRRLVKLADLGTCVGTSVDIIALVNDVGLPKTTRGTDLCCTIRVIDETKYLIGTSINIFIQTPQAFPCFASAGDIILLCNVKICFFIDDNEINATVYRDSSYFALFKRRDAVSFVPYQTYPLHNSTVTITDVDRRCIHDLRVWSTNFQIPPGDFLMLREIKEGHLNLACQILHCWKAANQWFVYVWDGTDTPPNVINAMPNDEINSPIPLELEPSLPNDEINSPIPIAGSILRIRFELSVETNHHPILNIGKWVKFVYLSLKVDSASGLWHGDFTPQSKIRYTPSDDCLVTERQRLYHDRMLKSGNRFTGMIPQSFSSLSEVSCITRIHPDHNHRDHCTLRHVLNHLKVPQIFKCVVRVVAVQPSQVENFYSPTEKYLMRLTLEDPTTRIKVFVFDKDGETLFHGYPSIEQLKRKLNILLGITECEDNHVTNTLRNPPWVSVCINSYRSKTNQRIFVLSDTKITDNP